MQEFLIHSYGYRASVRSEGAGLNSLTYLGRDLIDPFQPGEPHRFRGDVLAPWPNRIADGIYSVHDVDYLVPINEVQRRTSQLASCHAITY
jgi:aldose 1-epimerase